MEQAATNNQSRRAANNNKLSVDVLSEEAGDAKRVKMDHPTEGISGALASFDFTSIPVDMVTDLIVASLQAISQQALQVAVQNYKQTNGMIPQSTANGTISTEDASSSSRPPVKSEPVDPLQMDIEEEELDYEPDKLNVQLSGTDGTAAVDITEDNDMGLQFIEFRMPPPKDLSIEERNNLICSTMMRICNTVEDKVDEVRLLIESGDTSDLGILLLVRMVTRATLPTPGGEEDPQDVEAEEYDKATSSEMIQTIHFYSFYLLFYCVNYKCIIHMIQ